MHSFDHLLHAPTSGCWNPAFSTRTQRNGGSALWTVATVLQQHTHPHLFSLIDICPQQVPNPKIALILRDECVREELHLLDAHTTIIHLVLGALDAPYYQQGLCLCFWMPITLLRTR